MEELVWDADGRPRTVEPATYKIPTIGEVPEAFTVTLLERAAQPDVIYGSKAVGEPPLMLAISVREAIPKGGGGVRCERATTGRPARALHARGDPRCHRCSARRRGGGFGAGGLNYTRAMTHQTVINLPAKLALITDRWSPRIVAQVNDLHVKLVKVEGDFVWHSHADTDELFMILTGELRIDYRDGSVTLREGELHVVPKGVEHKPFAVRECQLMLLEPAGTVNTGDQREAGTAGTWL